MTLDNACGQHLDNTAVCPGKGTMSVHGPDAGRRKPWWATWRDGNQRTMRFATEHEAREFDALPTAAKAADSRLDTNASATKSRPGARLAFGSRPGGGALDRPVEALASVDQRS